MNTIFDNTYDKKLDIKLINDSLNGSKKALESLIKRHQKYIYNIAWKMSGDPDDAADITQEVFIKVITNLSKFKKNSSFRTWLYRITFNHFLNTKKSKMEGWITDFEQYGNTLEAIPDLELTMEDQMLLEDSIKEGQFRCMSAMLLCLTREQRIAYILGDIFGADHLVSSELLDITPSTYRKRISRARKDLYSFMDGQCGLINKNNPCRCRKKTNFSIQNGFIDPENLRFNIKNEKSIGTVITHKSERFGDFYNNKYSELQKEMPFSESNKINLFENIINSKNVREVLNFK
ncbi:RNA polymerase sigma factor [Flavivirga aquimarina]|uniref:RNA polymerase sigma factor n=1 Tax=Flavivirga aquimarina TaxID=2027862 RepID=A0ABT8WAV1_9FLAO|nr:RNA polymerase sigma factor [Flavivirga aquimarina]MDO5970277.1 RNA polymerase sigma factor [Flavivirga aquimarina]